jgi:hypothetical protein
MTQDEIIKMAWDSGAYTHRLTMWGFSLENLERFAKLVAAKAIAELESQEPVAWLEPEWGEKICPEVGYEVTITDDHPRDLCWIPLYPHPPQGEPVACPYCKNDATLGAVYYDQNCVECVKRMTRPQQRTWARLTDEETERLIHNFGSDPYTLLDEVDARLKARNT